MKVPENSAVRTAILFGAWILGPLLASAEQPNFKPMRFDQELAPADPNTDNRAFYYSNGKKILLNDTGLAVVKLKQNADAKSKDVRAKLSAAAPTGAIADLAPALERNGMMIVSTESPNGLNLSSVAAGGVEEAANALPIVEPDPASLGLNANVRPTQLIVTPRIAAGFKAGTTAADVNTLLQDLNLKVAQEPEFGPDKDGYVLELKTGPITFTRVLRAANALYEKGRGDGRVTFSHPDFIATKSRQAPPAPTDPLYGKQWHLKNVGDSHGKQGADVSAEGAWAITQGNPQIRIAIIDDSVQKDHPDLKTNFYAGRYYNGITNSFDDDPSPREGTQRHGTACAGVAVGSGNTVGGSGIAPKCGLIGIHIWEATVSQTTKGFYFADQQGAAIISCSWEWPPAFDSVSQAIKNLAVTGRSGKGTVVLFAAGNDYGTVSGYQKFGVLKEVMIIAASNWRDDHSKYSNIGPEISVCAPSSDYYDTPQSLSILTCDNTDNMPSVSGGGYSGYTIGDYTPNIGPTGFGGTSSATPLVAGICGLVLSMNPQLTATEVRKIIETTADKIQGETVPAAYDVNGHDVHYGYGRVNAKKAVEKAMSP